MVQRIFGRKGTAECSWTCETHDYICWQNWNSWSICVHAEWALSVRAHWAKPYPTPLKSCSGLCFLLWESNSKWSRRDPYAQVQESVSDSRLGRFQGNLRSSHCEDTLSPPTFIFKKKNSLLFPSWELGCSRGFGKLISDSCLTSLCTDLVPTKEPPESHFLFIFQSVSPASPSPHNYQARKLQALRRAWVYGSVFRGLSYICYPGHKRPRF